MLLLGLLALILVEGSAALALHLAAAEARLVADRRAALEADWALTTATTIMRLAADSTVRALGPGQVVVLMPPTVPGWDAAAEAERLGSSALVVVRVQVARGRAVDGHHAARAGTLLLARRSADTAIVLEKRPGW